MSKEKNLCLITLIAIVGLVIPAMPAFAAAEDEGGELRSYACSDKPIGEVLQELAEWGNINIVATPSVTGTVKVNLKDVQWRWALELILEANNLRMIEDEEKNVVKVMTQEEAVAQPLTTKVYTLVYLPAADYEVMVEEEPKPMPGAATMLTPILGEEESIQADPVGNRLILNATPARHYILKSSIAELDKMLQQVEIEVQFIETSTEAAKNLGIKWGFLKEYGVGLSNLGRDSEKVREEGTVSGTAIGDTSTSSVLDSLVTSKMVPGGNEMLKVFSRDLGRETMGSTSWEEARSEVETTVRTATLTASNINLVLSALFEDGDTKLVSHPKIATIDHQPATMKVVRQWPIPNWAFNSDTGTFEIQGVEFKDIGVTLRVTPHINEDDQVTLDVIPEVSAQVETVILGGGGGGSAKIPILDTRSAASRIRVKSGETVVIGGLVMQEEVSRVSGVPLLKSIPVLGYLFKHTSKTTVSRELMIFITPRIEEALVR
jgi:type IV pilus assembly protein PilQ